MTLQQQRQPAWRNRICTRFAIAAFGLGAVMFMCPGSTHTTLALDSIAEQDSDAPPADQKGDVQDREGRQDSWRDRGMRRRWNRDRFSRPEIDKLLVGVHEFKIEVRTDAAAGPVQVLVNGEPVDGSTAAFFLRMIRQQKSDELRASGQALPDIAGESQPGEVRPDNGHRRGGPEGRRGDDWRPRTVAGIDLSAELPAKFIEDVMEVIRDFEPNLLGRFQALQAENPDQFKIEIRRMIFRLAPMIELNRNNEKMYALKVREHQIEEELKPLQFEIAMAEPEGDAINDYRSQLRELLELRFDTQQELRGLELEKMSSRVDRIRQYLEDRMQRKEEILDEQVADQLEKLIPRQ